MKQLSSVQFSSNFYFTVYLIKVARICRWALARNVKVLKVGIIRFLI